ncbi:Hypothetical predicted protein [Mytilus galloprovincialis]|uniref:PiggyBac transposable element-derived protein domain-containing protein n=1 Tax=Mytilus galloprovincialis TaxID=29158 RepID=A0A8B6FFE0_MYTGA|nr:Hypothetical predicted protein [Mytilus galloprovincialis]
MSDQSDFNDEGSEMSILDDVDFESSDSDSNSNNNADSTDSEDEYVNTLSLYCGKGGARSQHDSGFDLVTDLVNPFYYKWHHVLVDNAFCSPHLCHYLLERNTYITGTVRVHRKSMPSSFKRIRVPKGEREVRQQGQLMAMKYGDRKQVTFLSTFSDPRLDEKNSEIEKLTSAYQDMKHQFNTVQDETLSLKTQLSDALDELRLTKAKTKPNLTRELVKPTVYLIGTSNIQGINEDKLTTVAQITKFTAYTLDDTSLCISKFNHPPVQILCNRALGGNPTPEMLAEDKLYLSTNMTKGIAQLASNIKRAIHSTLGAPLPNRQDLSRSRINRGRGRGSRGRGRGSQSTRS